MGCLISSPFLFDLLLEYERKPEKIANLVYGSRMGNGAESTGEGYKFRGRGYIQLTGKDNYVAFGKSINEDLTANLSQSNLMFLRMDVTTH